MIIIIAAIAAQVIFLGYSYYEYGWEWSAFFVSLLVGVLGFIGGAIICLVASGILSCQPIEDCRIEEREQIELVALKDGYQVEGSAFLFSSVVDQELKYTYIYETDYGRTTGSVDADKCYIKYVGNDTHPYIQEWEVMPKSDFINWLFVPSYCKYTIYLPEGSVIENVYEVDLE